MSKFMDPPPAADPAVRRYVSRMHDVVAWLEARLKATGHKEQAQHFRKTVGPALMALRQMALTEKVPRPIFRDHVAFVRDSLEGLEVHRNSAAQIVRKTSDWLRQFDEGPDGTGDEI